ncbi:hypothetical protein B5X24_HaOG212368 [Helicoverpa armigera]|nr:hypothetical protein B5X24_HaOG212368 [Helicoverpa armigera]
MVLFNEFVLVFLHIAVTMFSMTQGCKRTRRLCADESCRPCHRPKPDIGYESNSVRVIVPKQAQNHYLKSHSR